MTASIHAKKIGVELRIKTLNACTNRLVWLAMCKIKFPEPDIAAKRSTIKNLPNLKTFSIVKWGLASVHQSEGLTMLLNFSCKFLAISVRDRGSSNKLLELFAVSMGNFPQWGHFPFIVSFSEKGLRIFRLNMMRFLRSRNTESIRNQ